MKRQQHQINEPFAMIPLSLVSTAGITMSDIRLYVFLDNMGGKRAWWYGAQATIAAKTGLPERTIRECLGRLTRAGYIGIQRMGADNGTVNKYLVLARTITLTDEPQTGRKPPVASGENQPVAQQPSGSESPEVRQESAALTSIALHRSPQRPPLRASARVVPERNPIVVRLEAVYTELTLDPMAPAFRDEERITHWVAAGCTHEHIDAALAEIAEWNPDNRWAAFTKAVGRAIGASDEPRRRRGNSSSAGADASTVHPGGLGTQHRGRAGTGQAAGASGPPRAQVVGTPEYDARYGTNFASGGTASPGG